LIGCLYPESNTSQAQSLLLRKTPSPESLLILASAVYVDAPKASERMSEYFIVVNFAVVNLMIQTGKRKAYLWDPN
jgi:hypothetical protein